MFGFFGACFALLILVQLCPHQRCNGQVSLAGRENRQDLEPWEPGDILPPVSDKRIMLNPSNLLQEAGLHLIRWYRRDISPRSIDRCPYYPSCSVFAESALTRHGFFVGLCIFIDRNQFRENSQMYVFYDFVRAPSGILKLDDRFFLTIDH